jgi:hypothetical protein
MWVFEPIPGALGAAESARDNVLQRARKGNKLLIDQFPA